MADQVRLITDYSIKDASFSYPITIDEANETEVQLAIRPIEIVSDRNNTSMDYRICISQGDEWRENCRGMLLIHYET